MNRPRIGKLYSFIPALVTIAVACIFAACSGDSFDERLSQAESLIAHHPDSAMTMLAGMDRARMSQRQRARQLLQGAYIYVVNGNHAPLDLGRDCGGRQGIRRCIRQLELILQQKSKENSS